VYDWDPSCLPYWGIVVYIILFWLKMRLKWKTMFSKWIIVLKYTIKLELTIKCYNCCIFYLSGFWCRIGIQIVYITGVLLYKVF